MKFRELVRLYAKPLFYNVGLVLAFIATSAIGRGESSNNMLFLLAGLALPIIGILLNIIGIRRMELSINGKAAIAYIIGMVLWLGFFGYIILALRGLGIKYGG